MGLLFVLKWWSCYFC